jgi:hypothetical protein
LNEIAKGMQFGGRRFINPIMERRHDMLKRKLAGLAVAGLLLGAGAVNAAGSAIAGNADEGSTVLPSLSTYADQYRGAPGDRMGSQFADTGVTSAFPVSNAMD